jgi:Winged helix DNA-binding domain
MTEVSAAAAIAVRLSRQHLAERLPRGHAADAAVAGLQDTPPDAAGPALAARLEAADQDDLDSLVLIYTIRGAPLALAPQDLALFTAALDPPDDAAAKVLIGNAWKFLPSDVTPTQALDRVADATRDALSEGPLGRDAYHQALRERLPKRLLWWCRGCGTHHVHPSLWRAAGIRGVLAIAGRDGRTAIFAAPPPVPPVEDPGGALARRFLTLYGPSTPSLFAKWAGISPAHAKALWARAGELAPVLLEGKKAWVLADDVDAYTGPPDVRGVRLLPGYDAFLAGRDRELLLPDPAHRKKLWTVLGNPGAVLHDGRIAGVWRAAKKGRRLVVTVEPFGRAPARTALEAEAAILAPWRGADEAELQVA